MGKFILCAGPLAKEPYHFALTNTDVYSLEELGYYLYHNIYTISLKTFDEHFFRWIELELKRPDLAEKWREICNVSEDIKDIVVSILCATDYFTKLEIESLIKTVDLINDMLPIQRRKMEADNYLKYQDLDKALQVYKEIVGSDEARDLTPKEFGNILHNIAIIHVQMHAFERAEREFRQAYSLNQNEESLREYMYLLKLQHKDKQLMQEILEYNLSEETVQTYLADLENILLEAEATKNYKKIIELPALKESGKVGDYYYAIDTMIFKWKQQYKHGMEQA